MRLDHWLATHRVRVVRILLLVQVCGFAFFVAGSNGAFAPMPTPPTTTDFASFYAAGALANVGRAPQAYDAAAHQRAEAAAIAPGVEEKRFLNPPVFLLVCAPLARLPYLPAFVLFEAATCLAWLVLVTRIAGGGGFAAACLASVPAVWWALGWGQNSFLSGSLMALGTALLRRRPLLAGAAFGALCFKPHFGVLIPVALVSGRHWRAVLGAGLSVAGLAGLSAAVFGVETWRAFLDMAAHARHAVESGIQLSGHIDPGGALRLAGVGAGASWVVQAGATLAAACCVAWAFGRTRGPGAPAAEIAAANAVLVAATLTAMPFVLFYDLVMLALAAAWLAGAARLSVWRRREVSGLALAWIFSLLAYPAAAGLHLALGALAAPVILYFALRRLTDARKPA